MSESPFAPIVAAVRGKKRIRAMTVLTVLAVAYMARFAPEQIFRHWTDILDLLVVLLLVDCVVEQHNAPVIDRFDGPLRRQVETLERQIERLERERAERDSAPPTDR